MSTLRTGMVLVALIVALIVAASAAAETAPPPKYACDGFAEPLDKRDVMELRRGRVLPLKGKLVAADGSHASDKVLRTAPVVSLTYRPASGPEVDRTAAVEVHDYGKARSFVFDPEAHWKFDLGTNSLTEDGLYTVVLVSGDPKEYSVDPVCRLDFSLSR